jgi:hypothetical protein
MMIGVGMIKPNEYVVKWIENSYNIKGKYFNHTSHNWVSINNAESYSEEHIRKHFTLDRKHEVLRVEQDGTLTHIR